MSEKPKYYGQQPMVPAPQPMIPAQQPMVHSETTVYHKEVVRKYVGQWVHCHSVYGFHEGFVHRVLHDGIILTNHAQLAGGSNLTPKEIQIEAYNPEVDDGDITNVQFLPYPGMFIPYGGLFGLWPRPGFII